MTMTVLEIEAACNLAEPPTSLRQPLQLPALTLVKMFYPYGFPMEIRTNAVEVLDMAERLWGGFAPQHATKLIVSEVHVTEGEAPILPHLPTYRFVRPLFTSIVDGGNYVLSDLERGHSYTVMTRGMLESTLYVEYFFMMVPLGALPVKTVHAACVALDDHGVMLCGDSGAGKSTLSYACARGGGSMFPTMEVTCSIARGELLQGTPIRYGCVLPRRSCFRRSIRIGEIARLSRCSLGAASARRRTGVPAKVSSCLWFIPRASGASRC